MPPSLTRKKADKYRSTLTDLITKIKIEQKNPIIILGGDLNGFDIEPALEEFSDMREVKSPPTRNGERFDRIYTNEQTDEEDTATTPPLEAIGGARSDHDILSTSVKLTHNHHFEWVRYRTRDMREKNHELFAKEITSIEWERLIGNTECPSEMTVRVQSKITEITDRCFPWQDRKIRSTDDPWITDEIRRSIKTRRRRYSKYHRGQKWREAKKNTNTMIKNSKQEYYQKELEKIKNHGGSHVPYKALKELSVPDRPEAWTINKLRPSLTDSEIAEELATYFIRITDDFTPLDPAIRPSTTSTPYQMIKPHEVSGRIRQSKRVKSAVEGDVLPSLTNLYADIIAIPATRIFNYALTYGIWPTPWLTETQSAIPKCEGADNFDQLRNISCTNMLSKVLESFVLDRLQNEVAINTNQFGGIRGCGTTHFLVECWDRILRAVDQPESAASILSIDFSKAFNRMGHAECISALSRCGASDESIQMIIAFLSDRKMKFKVNGSYSTEREVKGGSPQGTRLGNFLFITTINTIEESLDNIPPTPRSPAPTEDEEGILGLRRLAGRIGAIRRFDSGVEVASTPCKKGTTDGVLRYFDASGRENSTLDTSLINQDPPAAWNDLPPWSLKYVDDVNTGERHYAKDCVSVFSQSKEQRIIHAKECERTFVNIEKNARTMGMKVNPNKTQLICIGAAIHSETSSFITVDNDTRIESQDELVLLGFKFGNRPTVTSHVKFIERKVNVRIWILRHLISAGVPLSDVTAVYKSSIRSVIEYASAVYHTMLSMGQRDELERLQRRCLKIIYGHRTSYAKALEISGLQKLEERRQVSFEKFAHKCATNDRLKHWFPRHRPYAYEMRNILQLKEDHANTERLYRSPLFTMRLFLNSGV